MIYFFKVLRALKVPKISSIYQNEFTEHFLALTVTHEKLQIYGQFIVTFQAEYMTNSSHYRTLGILGTHNFCH